MRISRGLLWVFLALLIGLANIAYSVLGFGLQVSDLEDLAAGLWDGPVSNASPSS